jgi:hypothetical protein
MKEGMDELELDERGDGVGRKHEDPSELESSLLHSEIKVLCTTKQ